MPLVVPVLRLAYVFLNVFDTFKVLRLPPPSARNGGQPSVRAMSQRKRAMKGTMTVWVVWACFTLYERWVETLVWLFIPFYSEIKALVIIFFLLTRAKGSEPIFLHLIRPLIKPYSVPLDALFDGLSSVGDLLVLVASIPVQFVQDYYRRWTNAHDPPEVDVQSWHRDSPRPGGRPTAHRAYASEANGDARPTATRDVSTGSMRQTRSGASSSSTPVHQIWHPPASAYADEGSLNPHTGLPTPPPIERKSSGGSVRGRGQRVPAPIVAPRPVRPSSAQFTGITEESDDDSNAPSTTRQGFRGSLQLPREPRNPGSAGDLSDEHDINGVPHTQTPEPETVFSGDDLLSPAEMSVDEDADSDMDYEDDDVFNTTLRTPYPRGRSAAEGMLSDDDMLTPPPTKMSFTMSIESQLSGSTALSTTDNGSSLRTGSISSTAASSLAESESSHGQKRRRPLYAEDNAKFSVRVSPRKAKAVSKVASARASARSATVGRQRGKSVAAAAATEGKETNGEDENDDENEAPSEAPSLESKRQKTAGGKAARPKPQRSDTGGTIRAAPARSTAKTTVRPAPSRQPSSRIAAARKDGPQLAKKSSATSTTSAGVARKTAADAQRAD